jgi:hypothetical protein
MGKYYKIRIGDQFRGRINDVVIRATNAIKQVSFRECRFEYFFTFFIVRPFCFRIDR